MLTITYETTLDDIVEFQKYHFRSIELSSGPVRRWRIGSAVIGFAIGFVPTWLLFSLGIGWSHGAALLYGSLIGCVGAIIAYMDYPSQTEKRLERLTRSTIALGKNKSLLGPRTLTLTPDHLAYHSEMGQGTLQWATIERLAMLEKR